MIRADEIRRLMLECGFADAGVCAFSAISDALLPCRAAVRLPERAQSVIMLLLPYLICAPHGEESANLSRYARVADYHQVAAKLLDGAAQAFEQAYPGARVAGFADHSPIPEVHAAVLAGLGARGKNGLLIHPEYGSWCFLAELVTDLPIELSAVQGSIECSGCGACVRACPSGALSTDGVFDKGKCRSAITQKKGELTEWEREQIRAGGLCWGCDVCQEACPSNRSVKISPAEPFRTSYSPNYPPGSEQKDSRAWEWRGEKTIRRNLCIIHNPMGNNSIT